MAEYSIIHTALSQFIASHLEGFGNIPPIQLVPDDDALMPQINKKTFEIKYSYRTEILILLENSDCSDLLLDYYFAVVCYLNNNFGDSRFFINRISNRISTDGSLLTSQISIIKDKIIYQLLFMILHEVGHGLFGISEEDRKAFYEMVDKDVELITERYEKFFSSFFVKIFMKLLYFKSKVFKTFSKTSKQVGEKYEMFGTETIETLKSFPEYISKPRKKEELACDLFALRTFQYIMEQLGINEKDYNDYYSAGLNAIQFISRYMWWESYFVKQYSSEQYHNKTNMDPLRVTFFFEECRANSDGSDATGDLYEKVMNNIPALKFEKDAEYLKELGERLKSIGTGAIQIDPTEKEDTRMRLIDAENLILSCVTEQNNVQPS